MLGENIDIRDERERMLPILQTPHIRVQTKMSQRKAVDEEPKRSELAGCSTRAGSTGMRTCIIVMMNLATVGASQ